MRESIKEETCNWVKWEDSGILKLRVNNGPGWIIYIYYEIMDKIHIVKINFKRTVTSELW